MNFGEVSVRQIALEGELKTGSSKEGPTIASCIQETCRGAVSSSVFVESMSRSRILSDSLIERNSNLSFRLTAHIPISASDLHRKCIMSSHGFYLHLYLIREICAKYRFN